MNGSSTATPDRLTYGVAMTACMHTANSKQADILFQRCNKKFKYGSSKKYNIEDTAMFSLMIATWDVVGSWSKVIVTYDEINALEGLKPSVDMINSALRASKRQQDWVKYDNVVSTLAVLGNIKRNYSTNDSVIAPSEEQVNNDSSVLSRKSLNECLIALEASSTTDGIHAGTITHNDYVCYLYSLLCIYSLLSKLTANVHSQYSSMKANSMLYDDYSFLVSYSSGHSGKS